MNVLCQEEVGYITQEFITFRKCVEKLHDIERLILGFTSVPIPIIPNPPIQDTVYLSTDIDYTTGCFMSRFTELSQAGKNLEAKEAAMDKIYPMLYNPNYLWMYSGFQIDEIIHTYPGVFSSDRTYSPVVREWYYQAQDNINRTMITEPYQDATTFIWIVTISKAFVDQNGNFFGVAGCDITLADLTTKVSKVKILEKGFLMIVSSGGMILTVPQSWNETIGQTILIFDEAYTGISESLWRVISESADGSSFEFTRFNTVYIFIKYSIKPFEDKTRVSHYLLIFGDKAEILEPLKDLTASYNENYQIIFASALVIGISLFFVVICFLHFYSKYLSKNLNFIKNIFADIVHRALMPNIIKNFQIEVLHKSKFYSRSFIEATKTKTNLIKKVQDKFSYFQWGSTRPVDKLTYLEWSKKIYPLNFYSNKEMDWKKSIPELINESK